MEKYKTVDEFVNGLDDVRRTQVQKLRHIILDVNPALIEHIKWNAPSYVLNNEDRITFNTMNKQQVVKLVFHMGVSKKENKQGEPVLKNAKHIEWVSDIRGYMTFNNLGDITLNKKEIQDTIREWLALPNYG